MGPTDYGYASLPLSEQPRGYSSHQINLFSIKRVTFTIVSMTILFTMMFDVPYTQEQSERPLKVHPHHKEPEVHTHIQLDKSCAVSYPGRPDHQYALMIDAGSTGSRIHVYRFNYCQGPSPTLEDEVFHQVKPGLSSYKNDPFDAASSIKELMEVAVKNVPAHLHSCTPVAVKATAGLRLLGKRESKDILDAVEELIRTKYKFYLVPDGVSIMDGSDEGVFAWITVNYLLKRIGLDEKAPTVAIADLGGASTQIVFEPSGSIMNNPDVSSYRYKLDFGGHTYNLYQHSYLGYGLMEARQKIKSIALSSHSKETPCLFAGSKQEFTKDVSSTSVQIHGNMENHEECRAHISENIFVGGDCKYEACSLINGVFQPSLTESFSGKRQDIYAFSYIYDRTEDFLDSPMTLKNISGLVDQICTRSSVPSDLLKSNPDVCLDLSYIYQLFKLGYGVDEDRQIYVEKKIQGYETGWCLGASIQLLDKMAQVNSLCKV